jgi:hypothetical protein
MATIRETDAIACSIESMDLLYAHPNQSSAFLLFKLGNRINVGTNVVK